MEDALPPCDREWVVNAKEGAMTARKKARKQEHERIDLDDQVGRAEQLDANGKPLTLDETERESAVMWLFSRGHTVPQILAVMRERYGKAGEMTRETPYRILQRAAKRGRLRYTPPHHAVYSERIRNEFSWLKGVSVVHTTMAVDVAREAANMLLTMVQARHRADKTREAIHVGFAAGMSMRQISQAFAERLRYPADDLPRRIVFHAMVTGYDSGNPTTDPNAFFTFWIYPPVLEVEVGFVGLHAPAMVRSEDIPKLKESREIEEAYTAAAQLDIIVTSGSDWDDEHSSLRVVCMERSPATVQLIRDLGGEVDVMWRPLGKNGPITDATEIRALTLMELTDLPRFIERGGSVLLMLGPCGMCKRSKVKVLHTTLTQQLRLVTHVVVDSRTAAHFLRMIGQQNNGHPANAWVPGRFLGDEPLTP